MTITYPLDVPLEEFSEASVTAVDASSIQVSEFTLKDRVQRFDGDYWLIDITYRNLNEENARKLSAFVRSLRTSVGTFIIKKPGYGAPFGAASTVLSSPLVDGDSQTGSRQLTVKNAPVSTADWLLAGDILQVGPDNRPHWHEVLSDVTTDAQGKATIDVWPSIRAGTVNNDVIILDEPRCLCRLVDAPEFRFTPPILTTFSMTAREALP